MNMHLNGKSKAIASAAIATTAIAAATWGALALIRKKRASNQESAHAGDADLRSNIGPGEINPYADTPTDPANQN